jgi:hypothetical protein
MFIEPLRYGRFLNSVGGSHRAGKFKSPRVDSGTSWWLRCLRCFIIFLGLSQAIAVIFELYGPQLSFIKFRLTQFRRYMNSVVGTESLNSEEKLSSLYICGYFLEFSRLFVTSPTTCPHTESFRFDESCLPFMLNSGFLQK